MTWLSALWEISLHMMTFLLLKNTNMNRSVVNYHSLQMLMLAQGNLE